MPNGLEMAPHDARAVANFLLDYASTEHRPLTCMALLKIIYFAHGWHLAHTQNPLVRNEFEAWEYGPVVRVVYDCFRAHEDKPIKTRAMRFEPQSNSRVEASAAFTDEEADLLRTVFKAYAWLDAFKLSEITHASGSPWDQVWNAPHRKVTMGMRIANEDIRQHFMRSEHWPK